MNLSDVHLILMWKIASLKNVDYASLIISTMRFCSSPVRNSSLPYANLLTLFFDHFNLLSDLAEVDYSGPQSLFSNIFPPLEIFKVHGSMSCVRTYPYLKKRIFKRSMAKGSLVLNLNSKNTPPIHISCLLTLR